MYVYIYIDVLCKMLLLLHHYINIINMASAYPVSDEEDLSSMFTQLDIETEGLISRSQKDKPQLCYLGYNFRKNNESEGIYYSITLNNNNNI